jgi:hypothetical protein
VLFFNSYRPGGPGSMDIWMAQRPTIAASWGQAVNVGEPVNAGGWDGNPSLSADGRTLYFASDRPGGSGGPDLWEAPVLCITDLNGDGRVDALDVQIVTESLGKQDSLCDIGPTPLGDGLVDGQDVAVLTQCLCGPVDDPTLAACWLLDESEGTAAQDTTGQHNGLLVGAPAWRPNGGAVGGCLSLDGVDDCVAVQRSCDASHEPLSVFAWTRGGRPGQVILSQQGGVNWLVADAPGGTLGTELRGSTRYSLPIHSQAVITDGQWHRVGVVLDGAGRTLYVDGVVVAQDKENKIVPGYGRMLIGAARDLAGHKFWSGEIDDVRIYDRVVRP